MATPSPRDQSPQRPPNGLINLLGSPSKPQPPPRPLSHRRRRAPKILLITGSILIALSITAGLLGLHGLFSTAFFVGSQSIIWAGFFGLSNRRIAKQWRERARLLA